MDDNTMVRIVHDDTARQASPQTGSSLNRLLRVVLSLLLVSAPIVPAAGGDDAGASRAEEKVQVSRAGAIDVGVRFDNADRVRAGQAERLVFTVSLDTHAVNLFSFDLETLAAVYLDGEPLEDGGFRWIAESETSHHRIGTLHATLPARLHGIPIGGEIELRIRDVATAKRVFRWDRLGR